MNEHNEADKRLEGEVRDPEDFNRQQRFKEIHDARQRVADYMAKYENRIIDKDHKHIPGTAPTFVHEQLAFRVALYIMELLPLLEKKAGDDPYMSDHFHESSPVNDLQQFAYSSGMLGNPTEGNAARNAVSVTTSLRVFQVANRAYANLGMELDVSEDRGDAGFDYSDILEEGPPGDGDGDKPDIAADGVTDK